MRHLSDSEIFLYIDGALPEEEGQDAIAHLASCLQCQKELQFLTHIEKSARGTDDLIVVEETEQNIVNRVLRQIDQESSKAYLKQNSSRIERAGFAVLGALLLGIVAIVLTGSNNRVASDSWFDKLVIQSQSWLVTFLQWDIWSSLLLLGGAFLTLYIIDRFITRVWMKPRT